MKSICLAILLLCLASRAAAADWKLYADGKSGDRIYVATDRISKTGDYIVIWDKFTHRKPLNLGSTRSDFEISQETISCDSPRSYRTDVTNAYLKDGTAVATWKTSDWHTLFPDTIMETVVNKICGSQ